MVHIKVKRGLDIPIEGTPTGDIKKIVASGEASALVRPPQLALNLTPFEDQKLRLLVKVGDVIKIGQPLAEDKDSPGRMFVSPASGTIKDIRRGQKRVLTDIIIDLGKEEVVQHPPFDLKSASKEQIIQRLKEGGAFAFIRSRPFNRLADPNKTPRSIFVKAVESAPFAPPAELQVMGNEKYFQAGLDALSKLSSGSVHLVHSLNSTFKPFTEAHHVQKHTVEGPHPSANPSLHIQKIDPIRSVEDQVWTLSARDVVGIGKLILDGKYHFEKVVSIAGPGVIQDRIGYFKAREGFPIGGLISGRVKKGLTRFISGDPLTGHQVNVEDFLGFYDNVFTVIPENTHREFLHFFGLGINKFTSTKAYLSGHLSHSDRNYHFTTNQHGEHRYFIDGGIYDNVMPLDVPTMLLLKAIMSEDFELAESYGLLEVDAEDFALPAFICPSKIEMTEIVKKGLKQYAKDVLQ